MARGSHQRDRPVSLQQSYDVPDTFQSTNVVHFVSAPITPNRGYLSKIRLGKQMGIKKVATDVPKRDA